MKVIFLDIDGPMIPERACYLSGQGTLLWKFDPVAVGLLLDVIEKTGAKLVVSSTWGHKGKEVVFQLFEDNGIPTSLVHEDWITPRNVRKRSDQIYQWLTNHPEVKKFAALDDENMTKDFGHKMILVTYEDGMLCKHHKALIELLGGREEDEVT